ACRPACVPDGWVPAEWTGSGQPRRRRARNRPSTGRRVIHRSREPAGRRTARTWRICVGLSPPGGRGFHVGAGFGWVLVSGGCSGGGEVTGRPGPWDGAVGGRRAWCLRRTGRAGGLGRSAGRILRRTAR